MDKTVLHAIVTTPDICQIVLSFLKFRDSVSLMYVDSKFCNEIPSKIETLKITNVPTLLNINRTFPHVKKCKIVVEEHCHQKIDISALHFPSLKSVIFNAANFLHISLSEIVISAKIQTLEFYVSMFFSFSMIQLPETVRILKLESNGYFASRFLELLPNLEDVDIYVNDTSKKCSLKFYQHSLRRIKCDSAGRGLFNVQSCVEIHSLKELEELRASNFYVSTETHCNLSKLRLLQLENQTSSVDTLIGQTKFPLLNLYHVQYRKDDKDEIVEDPEALRVYKECVDNKHVQPYIFNSKKFIIHGTSRYLYISQVSKIELAGITSNASYSHIFLQDLYNLESLSLSLYFKEFHWLTTHKILKKLVARLDSSEMNTLILLLTGQKIKDLSLLLDEKTWKQVPRSLLSTISSLTLKLEGARWNKILVNDLPNLRNLSIRHRRNDDADIEIDNVPKLRNISFSAD